MNVSDILEAIDQQIEKLQSARALLQGSQNIAEGRKPGRPKGGKQAAPAEKAAATPKKRVMSAEGKARIAAAQKARWAKQNGEGEEGGKKRGPRAAAPRKTADEA